MYGQTMDWFVGDTYPGMGGTAAGAAQATNVQGSLGGATAGTPATTATGGEGDDQISRAAAVGAKANPVTIFFALVALIVLAMWGAHKVGDEGDYKNIRLSAYNFLFIGLVAAIGLFFWRTFFTKFPVPGITTIFHVA